MRSLYQCYNAKVNTDRIYCPYGKLGTANDGTLHIFELRRGAPLEITFCQTCENYDEMGESVQKSERGWR